MSEIWDRIRGRRRSALTCKELVELITEYLEGAMSKDEQRRFEEHLDVCDGCSNYIDQMRQTLAVVGRIETDAFEPAMKAELLSAFRGWPRD